MQLVYTEVYTLCQILYVPTLFLCSCNNSHTNFDTLPNLAVR